ncbi:MAG: polysaccharide biosynthesis protein, partial [Peptostreptococcaceae bacterium]|nr:polysaccharide biosynthesis protein [Peptostreptococcaceae bacterium]
AKEFFIKPLITVIAMFASVKLAYGFVVGMIGNSLATIVSIGVGAIVYVVLVFALGVISKEDLLKMPKGNKIYRVIKKLKLMK